MITVGRNGDGIRLVDGGDRRLCAGHDGRACRPGPISCGCRWSADSRSRTRWSRPVLPSRPAATAERVFAALERAEGRQGPARSGRRAERRAGLRRLRAQAGCAGEGARSAAALCQAQSRRRVRRRRRPRQGQAPADGRDSGQERRPRHRHRRQSAQREPGVDPRGDPEGRRAPSAREIGDRREAIRSAVAALEPGDVLLDRRQGPRNRPDRRRPDAGRSATTRQSKLRCGRRSA